jgi:hypothetical protein
VTLSYTLRIKQGETWRCTFPVTQLPSGTTSVDGMTARAQVRAATGAATVLYEWSAANGNITAEDLSVILTVGASESSAWTWRRGVYDLELTDPIGGGTACLASGWVYVTPEITR